MKQIYKHLFACLCLTLLLASTSYAQNVTGSITGTVKDQSGAVVSGATVTIINIDTGVEVRSVKSDSAGIYSAPVLPIGNYKIVVADSGFAKETMTGIVLHVNDQLKEDLTLKPASVGEDITVEAQSVQVDTESATAAGLINGTQIRELSLNNRNYEQLVALQPGVTYGGGDQIFVGTTNPQSGSANVVSFSINGQRNSSNNWTIDGADNVDRGSSQTLMNYPSVDAIAEFKTLRGEYSPEFGRDAGGQINVVTKSGTNAFHGDVYEFFRNDVLNANTWANKQATPFVPRNKLRYNDFGGTIGGPVRIPGLYNGKDKTFFFFSEEARRIITYATFTAVVPTANQRAGIFATPVCVSVNPATGACNATGTTVTNVNPVAQAYLKDIFAKVPLPNAAGSQLISSVRNIFNTRQEIVRLDHNLTNKLNLSFRFINDNIPTTEPGGLFTGDQIPGLATTQTNSPGKNYLGRFTDTFSPTLLIDGGYAYAGSDIISNPIGLIATKNSPDINPALPFQNSLTRVPTVTLAGFSSLTSFGPYRMHDHDHQTFGNLTKIIDQHTLKFGGVYHRYLKTENAGGNNTGTFSFDQTAAPAGANNLDQTMANFLSGYVTTFTQASLDITPVLHTNQFEIYGQDQWKVRHNVTLTYGVRWSVFQSPTDSAHLLTAFDPRRFDPSTASKVATTGSNSGNIVTQGDPLDGIIIGGKNSPWGGAVGPTSYTNFAPRLGLAWDVSGDGKTSIRTGYGMVYDSSLFGTYEQNAFANPPFVSSLTLTGGTFDNISGGKVKTNRAPLALHSTPVTSSTPYTEQWSLDVQQELPASIIADIGYYGSGSHHLIGIADINQPHPAAYVTAGLTDKSGNSITTGGLRSSNIYAINGIRPYVGYDAINTIEPWFGSNYNSLQVALRKQFKGDSLIGINYTWSHALTDMQTDRSTAPQNTYCVHCEYGSSQLDRRQAFTADYVYQLPFLQAQRGIVGHVLGGWEVSGILRVDAGLPLTVTTLSSADPAGLGVKDGNSVSGPRPDQIADPNANAPHTAAQWFNTAAFANVPSTQARPGDERRGQVLGPHYFRTDFSLFKNIKFTERFTGQFRAEAFNVLNHTNYNGVSTSLGSSLFGKVTSAYDPRIMQLGMKLYF